MKFEYSPGLLGYGPKGTNGITGLDGMAIYFTDFDPQLDIIKIRYAIEHDEVLWAKAEPGTKLPEGRKYITGDIFITQRGNVYVIDAENNVYSDDFVGTITRVQMYELSNPTVSAEQGFKERWLNRVDPSYNRYLIDNVNSSKSNYLVPNSIYGIDVKDFVRIEYTDTSAFTLYSSAENALADEHKALALIQTPEGFRLGNINDTLRNTNLTLDVSLLTYTHESSKSFSSNTPVGTVLTNNEIDTNLLFSPSFNPSPASFYMVSGPEYADIQWNLEDFTTDPSINATLVFNKETTGNIGGYLGSHKFDSSLFQPMVFENLDSSGFIRIKDLAIGTWYQYYIVIEKDGWKRYSICKRTNLTSDPAHLIVTYPENATAIIADHNGKWKDPSTGLYTLNMEVSTNSITGYNTQIVNPMDTWINLTNASAPVPGIHNFDVSLSKYTGQNDRIGNISIMSEAPTVNIIVKQEPEQRIVQFNSNGYIYFDPVLTDQTVYIVIEMGVWCAAHGGGKENQKRHVRLNAQTIYNGTVLSNEVEAGADSNGSTVFDPSQSGWKTTTNVFLAYSGTSTYVQFNGRYRYEKNWHPGPGAAPTWPVPTCLYDSANRWFESMGYARIVSAQVIPLPGYPTGTGRVDVGPYNHFYHSRLFYFPGPFIETVTCVLAKERSTTKPLHPGYYP